MALTLIDYNDLAITYSIPAEEVESITSAVIGDSLTQAFGSLVLIENGQAYIYSQHGVREILPEEIKSNIKRMINHQVEAVLDAVMSQRQLSSLIRHENQIVWGTATWRKGYLVIDIEGVPAVGFCKLEAVAEKERLPYNPLLSGKRAYYVCKACRSKSVAGGKQDDDRKLPLAGDKTIQPKSGQLILNRTSDKLPKLFIESLAWEEGVNTEVTVERRIPGAYSKISLSEKVPGSVLFAAMKELNEKIIVKPVERAERTHQNRTGI